MPRQPQVHFRLKSLGENAKQSIYLQYIYNGFRLFFSFGEFIKANDWNDKKQRVKNKLATTSDGRHSLNDTLDELENIVYKTYREQLKNGIPTPETIKNELQNFLNRNKQGNKKENDLYSLIDQFISGEIGNAGQQKTKGTLANYKSLKLHLEEFEAKTKYLIDYDSINLIFFNKYTTFLRERKIKLAHNTILKDIKRLKTVMSAAVDFGYTTNLQFRHSKFKMREKEVYAVSLTDEEILKLYNFDLSENIKLEKVKDLFVFGCYTGLRFSDYSNIKPENIKQDGDAYYIDMITQKTNEPVMIPTNPIILEIFKKYSANLNKLPTSISNQKFNKYIKEVCQKVGMIEKGRLIDEPQEQLYNHVASHTARRSFATNLYLEGFPVHKIMKITGHKTENAFMKYVKVSKIDAAKELKEHIKKNWSEKMLRIAS